MTLRNKIIAVAAAVVLVLAIIGAKSALGSYAARIRMEAESKAERRFQASADEQIAANNQKHAAEVEALRKEKLATPKERLVFVNKYIPLSTPIVAEAKILPDAPSYKLTDEQLSDIARFTLACKNCEADRAMYMANESLQQKKLQSVERERDTAQAAARGGTKWQRFKGTLKTLGIGVGAGAGICAVLCK